MERKGFFCQQFRSEGDRNRPQKDHATGIHVPEILNGCWIRRLKLLENDDLVVQAMRSALHVFAIGGVRFD